MNIRIKLITTPSFLIRLGACSSKAIKLLYLILNRVNPVTFQFHHNEKFRRDAGESLDIRPARVSELTRQLKEHDILVPLNKAGLYYVNRKYLTIEFINGQKED